MRTKKVKHYMTKNVFCFKEKTPVLDVVKGLSKKRISGAPIVDSKNNITGIISVSDITKMLDVDTVKIGALYPSELGLIYTIIQTKRRMTNFAKKIKATRANKIKEIMNREIVTISRNSSVYNAATLMDNYDINRIPVVDKNNKLKGIITRNDVIKALI